MTKSLLYFGSNFQSIFTFCCNDSITTTAAAAATSTTTTTMISTTTITVTSYISFASRHTLFWHVLIIHSHTVLLAKFCYVTVVTS